MAKRNMKRPVGPPPPAALWQRLFEPVDAASLVFMRVAFGTLMAWECYRYLLHDRIGLKYLATGYLVGWPGFGWVQRLPGDGLYWLFWGMFLASLCVAVGLVYRVAIVLFGLGFGYVFLISQGGYQNHFYLICLFSLLLALAPANRAFSVDARLRAGLRSETIPAWPVWMLRCQLGALYFFGGVAKLQTDWLQGYPMRLWLKNSGTLPVLGEIFWQPWVAVAMSWSGMLLDLFAFPALLHRRTRPFAFTALACFHLWNSRLFHIGVFPWLAIASTLIFFPPDWPRRVFNWPRRESDPGREPFRWSPDRRALAAFIAVYLMIQLLAPLRWHLYEGDPSWTGAGHEFSWRMMLRSKRGIVKYRLTDRETEESWWVNPAGELSEWEYLRLVSSPSMIQLYAHHLADLASEEGRERVRVHAVAVASMNSREPEPLIDPEVDLAAEPIRLFGSHHWVPPYTKSIQSQRMKKAALVEGGGPESD